MISKICSIKFSKASTNKDLEKMLWTKDFEKTFPKERFRKNHCSQKRFRKSLLQKISITFIHIFSIILKRSRNNIFSKILMRYFKIFKIFSKKRRSRKFLKNLEKILEKRFR